MRSLAAMCAVCLVAAACDYAPLARLASDAQDAPVTSDAIDAPPMSGLPIVSFETAMSAEVESVSPAINVVLSKAPQVQTTVDLVLAGGTVQGADASLATATVTFAAGEMTKAVTLTVNDDGTDEDDQTAILTLTNAVNATIGSQATHMHTIQDNDAPPTVSFGSASSSSPESAGTATITVNLSAASEKPVDVAFSVNGSSSATSTTDYSITTTSPLAFSPGETQHVISSNIVQDAAIEPTETVIVDLGTLSNATAGSPGAHTLSITDDDGSCFGGGGYAACFVSASISSGTVTLSGTLNTTTDARCKTPDSGWSGQPSTCFIVADAIVINGALTVTGSKPLGLAAKTNINVSANIDAASHRTGASGPGTEPGGGCATYQTSPTNSNGTAGAGGGAGASFRSTGGNGGNGGIDTTSSHGVAPLAQGVPSVLRGGCAGQNGGMGTAGTSMGGAGGGAVYLVAAGAITINSGIIINVSGAGATAPGFRGGGAGGGSGGMIKLYSTTVSVTGAVLMANGGGGSSGGDDNTAGLPGSDPVGATPATPAQGGVGGAAGAGANGGNGFAGSSAATSGASEVASGSVNAGGGGGGGGGHIESNQTLTGATVSAGP